MSDELALRPRGRRTELRGLLRVAFRRFASLVAVVCLACSAFTTPAGDAVALEVTPAGEGRQLVRTSVLLPRGFLSAGETLAVRPAGHGRQRAGVRVLSWHPEAAGEPRTARRVLLSFTYRFTDRQPRQFDVERRQASRPKAADLPVSISFEDEGFRLCWKDGREVDLRLLAPGRRSTDRPRVEWVEENAFYAWKRFHFPDPDWPRVVEVRLDALGQAVVVAHLLRGSASGPFAPDFGWEFTTKAEQVALETNGVEPTSVTTTRNHSFTNGVDATGRLDRDLVVYHPAAPFKRRGGLEVEQGTDERWTYRYWRCRETERVPMQSFAWQRAEIVLAPPSASPLTPALLSPHRVRSVSETTRTAAKGPLVSDPLPTELQSLLRYHRDAVVRSVAIGDDYGNVTGYSESTRHGGVFGMNRLNHGAAIFEEGEHAHDARLTEAAVLWCDNFHDQSIWWGEPERGGTRYNNVVAMAKTPPTTDYMWRSDSSVNFCTKGYDCFWLAWEATGDPRMREALEAQTDYAARHLHANRGECRNIGDVRDFVRLHRFTGEARYLEEALRLFRELRTKLSPERLFDQGGKPLSPDESFIDDDQRGLKTGYAKPYILGYALAGLPELIALAPQEADLRETVRAVADFLASTVDPSGGWRYPHPSSSAVIISQGLEHAWQLLQAVNALGPEPRWLDAIGTVLRARIHAWRRSGTILSGLEGWEVSTGRVKERQQLHEWYHRPGDRDRARDYREGRIGSGSAPPEGIVYFGEVLAGYLRHRPVESLLQPPTSDEPLGQVLARLPEKTP